MTKDRTSGVARPDSDGASTMDLSGRCVGNSYILQRPIGQGATGTIWRAVERASGEPVAVKLLHESLLRQPKLVTRFVQERTILLMLRHRNVVRVRDLFSVGETLGLVMDLVDGGSLRDHLRRHHTVPAGEAARLAAQVAAALAEAHELGIIHRDLKPDNVLLQIEDGRLDTRLTDFGIARILNTPSMTTANTVVGTPHYMAPEAFHGATASPATDVYALGILLYELVSGRPPYDSDSIPDLMRRHSEGNPQRRPGIPDGIWALITQCMEIKPLLRPSAVEMVAELSDAARAFADVPALPGPEVAAAAGPNQSDVGLELPRPGIRVPVQGGPASVGGGGLRSVEAADGGTGDPEAVSLLPLPLLSAPLPSPQPQLPLPQPQPQPQLQPPSPSPQPQPGKSGRDRAAPRQRRPRHGATVTTIVAGAMLAVAVAAAGFHHRDRGGDTADPATPAIQATPTASARQFGRTSRDNGPRRAAGPKHLAGPRTTPTGGARPVTSPRVPAKVFSSPQTEAERYGPWQCTRSVVFDDVSRLPLTPSPCQMLGRDIRYQASLTAPGGGAGSITLALEDAGSGETVAGPVSCGNLAFGTAATWGCGPAWARPARGRRYLVSMSFRYVRGGRTMVSTTRGNAFTW
ncbi:serine/threonine protein kinase [Actinoplanes sp. KI2]|uniref:serine/threonine-protein kinase n=1 Tax=Actinoplanes sp. KI2 TaxID=2983315 RepID=UPI0021D5BCA1|nr:serine/threonine-protein kinase [Actinoplanes sp. KI2]MCU7725149.1 serine/threonine protein kinase [Actinoplanes sp. KI2]